MGVGTKGSVPLHAASASTPNQNAPPYALLMCAVSLMGSDGRIWSPSVDASSYGIDIKRYKAAARMSGAEYTPGIGLLM